MRLYFKQQRSLSSWKAFPPHPPVTWAEEALSQRSTCNLTARSGPLMERGSPHVGLVRPCPALKCCPANGIPLRRHGVNDLTFCLKVVIDDDCLASCGCCELVAEATAAGLRAAGLLSSQQVRTYLSTRPEAFPGARQSPDWPSQPFPACAWASRPFNVPSGWLHRFRLGSCIGNSIVHLGGLRLTAARELFSGPTVCVPNGFIIAPCGKISGDYKRGEQRGNSTCPFLSSLLPRHAWSRACPKKAVG